MTVATVATVATTRPAIAARPATRRAPRATPRALATPRATRAREVSRVALATSATLARRATRATRDGKKRGDIITTAASARCVERARARGARRAEAMARRQPLSSRRMVSIDARARRGRDGTVDSSANGGGRRRRRARNGARGARGRANARAWDAWGGRESGVQDRPRPRGACVRFFQGAVARARRNDRVFRRDGRWRREVDARRRLRLTDRIARRSSEQWTAGGDQGKVPAARNRVLLRGVVLFKRAV